MNMFGYMFLPILTYLQQSIFEVRENSSVTCAAMNCWEKFQTVVDMVHHLAEKCDLSKVQPGRDQFQHQFSLSNIARLFSCKSTVLSYF